MAKTGQKQVIFQKNQFLAIFCQFGPHDVRNGKNQAETGFFPK
jgi:hypothetical protein